MADDEALPDCVFSTCPPEGRFALETAWDDTKVEIGEVTDAGRAPVMWPPAARAMLRRSSVSEACDCELCIVSQRGQDNGMDASACKARMRCKFATSCVPRHQCQPHGSRLWAKRNERKSRRMVAMPWSRRVRGCRGRTQHSTPERPPPSSTAGRTWNRDTRERCDSKERDTKTSLAFCFLAVSRRRSIGRSVGRPAGWSVSVVHALCSHMLTIFQAIIHRWRGRGRHMHGPAEETAALVCGSPNHAPPTSDGVTNHWRKAMLLNLIRVRDRLRTEELGPHLVVLGRSVELHEPHGKAVQTADKQQEHAQTTDHRHATEGQSLSPRKKGKREGEPGLSSSPVALVVTAGVRVVLPTVAPHFTDVEVERGARHLAWRRKGGRQGRRRRGRREAANQKQRSSRAKGAESTRGQAVLGNRRARGWGRALWLLLPLRLPPKRMQGTSAEEEWPGAWRYAFKRPQSMLRCA